jgi:hypothetical protein
MQRRIGHLFVVDDDDALNRRLVSATLAWEGLHTSVVPSPAIVAPMSRLRGRLRP